MEQILELTEHHLITGEIYLITHIRDNKKYIGQTRSHRKNKGKYRPFGIIGRFKDHISEAINNTKKNQCCYLNNAIRKYGSANFEVILLEKCDLSVLNDREKYYISQFNTLYPNGYNLTPGGKYLSKNKVKNNYELLNPKKRGREFGFKHSQLTRDKMKLRLNDKKIIDKKKSIMSSTMISFYVNKKIKILEKYVLDNDVTKYIKPVCKKNSNIIHDYIIRINGRKLTLCSRNITLEEKYKRLLSVLTSVKTKQIEEQKVKIVEICES